MKKYLLFIALLFASSLFSVALAQIYNMSNLLVTDNTGTLYDSGGPTGDYGNGEFLNFTICPQDFQGCILIDFTSFEMNLPDILEIYDGGGIVASLTKGAVPVSFVVYNSCTTIRFISNNLSTDEGWELSWTTVSDCPPPAPNDCIRAVPVCDNGVLNFNSFGPGNDDFASSLNDKGCLTGNEHQSAWYQIKVGDHPTDGGLLEFVLTPEAGAAEDYDFAIFGPNLTCDDLGAPIRCSYADDNCHFCPETGLGNNATDTWEGAVDDETGAPADGFVAALPVQSGQIYFLLIDNFNASSQGFDLAWGADVVLDCSILGCDLSASVEAIGETTICSNGNDIQLQGLFENNTGIPTYYWQADPPEAVNFLSDEFSPNPIIVADSIPQDFNQFVVYTLTIADDTCTARANTTVQIYSVPEPPPVDTLFNYCTGDEIQILGINTNLPGIVKWYDADPSLDPTLIPISEGPSYVTNINENIPGTHHFWATETNIICEGEPTAITINIFPVPELESLPEQAFCSTTLDLSTIPLTDVNGLDLSEATRQYFISPDLNPSSAIDSIVTASGIYWIMVDYFGCVDATAVIVKLGDLTVQVDTQAADCGEDNGEATVFTNNGIPPYSYYWSTDPIQTGATATNLAAGIYNVTISDATDCILTEQFAIFAPPLPEAIVSSDLTIGCLGDSIQLFGTTFSIGANISYVWTGPNDFISIEQNPQIVITDQEEANEYTLIVTVDGCTSLPKSIEIFVLPTPIIDIAIEGTNCPDSPITLTAEVNASGNGGNLEYYWNNTSGLIGTEKDWVIDNPVEGMVFTLVVRRGTCWSDTASTTISIQEIPQINVSNTSPVCIGENITLQSSIETDSEDVLYGWTGPNNFVSEEQNPIVENAPEGGVYEFTATVNGCLISPTQTTVAYHIQPDLPGDLPSIFACSPPFDLTTLEIIDNNGQDLTLSYFNDEGGNVGNLIENTTVEGIDYYWIFGETIEGCADSVRVSTALYPKITANFTFNKFTVCADEEDFVTITFTGNTENSNTAIFNWDFDGGIAIPGTGRGPHQVRWDNTESSKTITLEVIENGCSAETQQNIILVAPLLPPIVNCTESSTNSVSFDWEDIENSDNFEIIYNINGGTNTTVIDPDSEITIGNLNPDDEVHIEVRALGEAPCGDSEWAIADCKAQNCPLVNVSINGLETEYCIDASPINLVGEPSGGTFSGLGVVGNQFFPNQAGPIVNTPIAYTYIDATTDCEYGTSQTVTVYELPSVLFELSENEICSDNGTITINYTGNATTAADFDWDFDGGNAVPGNGIGPHTVDWSGNIGSFNISLSVSENDCNSPPYSQVLTIVEPLTIPEVNCIETSTNSVTFEWNSTNGLGDFQITYYINNVLESTFNSTDTQLMVDGLTPNDEVRIEVIEINTGICGNSETVSSTCIAQECPVVELNFIDLQTEFCVGDDSLPLDATPPNGRFYLDGNLVTSIEANGLFPGDYLLEYLYEEGDCDYSIDEIITIHAIPTADFALSPDSICLDSGETTTTLYEGTAGTSASFEWDFGSGVSPTFEGNGPHTIEWNQIGTQTVSLVVEENGCRSESVEQSIEILSPLALPQVICAEVSLQSVRFEWDVIEGAIAYEIQTFVNDIQTSIDTSLNLNFILDNLNTLDKVEIFVTALGNEPCGNSEANSQICVAQDCPEIEASIGGLADTYCQTAGDISLTATPEGGVFSGEGILLNDFQPSTLAAGSYTIVYTFTDENDCEYSTQSTVEIFEPQTFELQMQTLACKDETLMLSLSGNLENIASLDWQYEEGMANLEDLGNNLYNLTWQTSGNQTIGVEIEDSNGCSSFISSNINVYELEVFSIADSTIQKGDTIELTSQILSDFSTGFVYSWTEDGEVMECDNCPTALVHPDTLTLYELSVMDENGCLSNTFVQIEVEKEDEEEPIIEVEPPSNPLVVIPNAFSPNQDGFNDYFQITGYQIETVEFAVYNRWGKKVFEGFDASMAWDGTFKEEIQPIGTYVYTAIVIYEDGSQEFVQGNLTLIR